MVAILIESDNILVVHIPSCTMRIKVPNQDLHGDEEEGTKIVLTKVATVKKLALPRY